VVEKTIGSREGDAYRDALEANRPLVKKIRYAFEFLKPEGLSLLRHWVEGDEFDYRALIDAAIDQQMGRIPSDRLYIKRLKREREVAVLLLVDLSRSTANTVGGTSKTVLDIEREAIVLFCEALQVVGDSFAVAGFSGTGRLGVDYWCVKDFNEPMGDEIRKRINAMAPQRSTRMGAAIRHAASRLEKIPKKVRLLIVLGDGFPNDAGYKGEYAVSDTRRAIAEARAKGIYLRPITVNLIPDQQLDRMYGHRHHTVIADVRELPDKLWRIYSSVTR
jgi:nitric oxide reductase activation protein